MKTLLTAVAALALAAPLTAAHHETKPSYAAALADPGRSDADKARDAARKPAELLAFAEVKQGQTVVDYIMGGGYLTRILASAVGPKGKVYAFQPSEFIGFRAAYGTEQDAVAAAYKNVVPLRPSAGALTLPEPVDAIVTVQNWHDLHLKAAPAGTAEFIAKALFASLKPGGVFVVVDHAAAAGTGANDSDKLHRIEPGFARAEIEKAGFVFDGELKTWSNPDDPRTALVFDPAIRGKTDQFAYRFRKPK
jgi:predicted methyltransferase